MIPRSLLYLTAVATCLFSSVTAIPVLEERGDGVCNSGIYAELSILSAYPPAMAFCSLLYPVRCTSSVFQVKRAAAATTTATTSKTTTKSITTTTTTTDGLVSAYQKCLNQPFNVISTICSCIETAKPCSTTTTAKVSTTTTTSPAATTKSSTSTTSTTTLTTTTTTTTIITTTPKLTTTIATTSTTTSTTTSSSSTTTQTTTTTTPSTTTTSTPTTTSTTTTSTSTSTTTTSTTTDITTGITTTTTTSSTTTDTTTSSTTTTTTTDTTTTTTTTTTSPAPTCSGQTTGSKNTIYCQVFQTYGAYTGAFQNADSQYYTVDTPDTEAISRCAAFADDHDWPSFRVYLANNNMWYCDGSRVRTCDYSLTDAYWIQQYYVYNLPGGCS